MDEETLKLKAYRLTLPLGKQEAIDREPTTPPEMKAFFESPLDSFVALQEDISKEDTLRYKSYQLPERANVYGHGRIPQSLVGNVPTTPSYDTDVPFTHLSQFASYPPSVQDTSELPTQVTLKSITPTKKKKWLGLSFRIGCTILLFAVLFKSFSWSSFLDALSDVDEGQLLVGFIVGLFCIVASAYQWRSLLRAERIKFDLAELVDLYLIGIAFSHFLPTGMGGDAVKAIRVGNASGNNAGSASAVVMSRVTGFFGMMMISIPVLLIWHAHFNNTITLWFFILSLLVSGMIGGAVFFAVLLPRLVKGKWITHKVFKSGIKIGKALSVAMQRPRSLGIAILYGLIFWICSCLNHYAYGIALGIHLPLYFYCVAVPFVSLVTFLPISINGFGLREGAFVYIFSTMHVSPATALLLALLMDAQALLFGSMGGLLYLFTGNKAKSDKQLHVALNDVSR